MVYAVCQEGTRTFFESDGSGSFDFPSGKRPTPTEPPIANPFGLAAHMISEAWSKVR